MLMGIVLKISQKRVVAEVSSNQCTGELPASDADILDSPPSACFPNGSEQSEPNRRSLMTD